MRSVVQALGSDPGCNRGDRRTLRKRLGTQGGLGAARRVRNLFPAFSRYAEGEYEAAAALVDTTGIDEAAIVAGVGRERGVNRPGTTSGSLPVKQARPDVNVRARKPSPAG